MNLLYENIKIITLFISIFCIINLASIFIYSAFKDQPNTVRIHKPQHILIFAAHQDDGVIQAGGSAIQNSKIGGKTYIVYLTIPSEPKYALIRKKEAKAAWEVLNDNKINLEFLDFHSRRIWSNEKISVAERKIITVIEKTNPNTIYIPLNEGGHAEHDLLNSMVLNVINQFTSIKVIQSAEYNPYYIMMNTPTKVIWFLTRLLPFVPYKEPNYGLNPSNQTKLHMSQNELQTKIKMLLKFESQKETIPLNQFGYEDIFDSTKHKPKYFVKISGKYLSFWTFITIVSIQLMLVFWGGCLSIYYKYKKLWMFIILIISWTIIMVIFLTNSKRLIEDFTYIISFLSGMLLGIFLKSMNNE